MSFQSNFRLKHQTADQTLLVKTDHEQWVIPYDCDILKILLKQRRIQASDFVFDSSNQCQQFVKGLFLLALQDEYAGSVPSPIAELARDLLHNPNSRSTISPE